MASKRRVRAKACGGKVAYSSKEAAWRQAMRLHRLDGAHMRAYRCAWCGHYHVGHAPARARG